MDEWYYVKQGERQGPFALENMKVWVQVGEIDPDTKVWKPGLAEWVEARTQDVLFPAETAAEPAHDAPPPVAEADRWAADVIESSDLVRRLRVQLGPEQHQITYAMSPSMGSEEVSVDDRVVWRGSCHIWQTGRIEFTLGDDEDGHAVVIDKHFDKRTWHQIRRFQLAVDERVLYAENADG
jgi:hypothetical protein